MLRIGVGRFIPACAGNTKSWKRVRRPMSGSSPRARGTPARAWSWSSRKRFIPACAGNTPTPAWSPRRSSVHPRVRGEHLPPEPIEERIVGSSPRARGTPARSQSGARECRFIPACAGNTSASPEKSQPAEVHPRVRGEHIFFRLAPFDIAGSSPRARGTRPSHRWPGRSGRFIPACAGNTAGTGHKRGRFSVHPRVRGEHTC